MYTMVKHIHLTAIALSVILFILRFIWTLRHSPMMQKKWVKVVPHVVDTILLASAAVLCVILAQYPLVNHWLTEKVIGVLFYILMGLWTLKWARTMPMRWIGFVGAITWLAIVAKIAVTKQPFLFT